MDQEELKIDHEELAKVRRKDVRYSWVSSSRFIFYIQVTIYASIILGGCYTLYQHKYHGKPNVEIPSNTNYNPTYK